MKGSSVSPAQVANITYRFSVLAPSCPRLAPSPLQQLILLHPLPPPTHTLAPAGSYPLSQTSRHGTSGRRNKDKRLRKIMCGSKVNTRAGNRSSANCGCCWSGERSFVSSENGPAVPLSACILYSRAHRGGEIHWWRDKVDPCRIYFVFSALSLRRQENDVFPLFISIWHKDCHVIFLWTST